MKYVLSKNRLGSVLILAGIIVIVLLLAFPTSRNGDSVGNITITEGFIRATAGQDDNAESVEGVISAAYFTIENAGNEDVALISVETASAGATQIHMTMIEDNVASMDHMSEGVVIPAGGTVSFEPGGMHVMLMDLPEHLRAGDDVTLTLNFDDGTSHLISLTVE